MGRKEQAAPLSPSEQLARLPDLTESLRQTTPEVQRQVFENKKALGGGLLGVVLRDIAGAGYFSRGDAPVLERLAA
jgi:hypothetical protein